MKVTFVFTNLVFPVFCLDLSIDRRNYNVDISCQIIPPKWRVSIVNQRDRAYVFRNIFETFRQTSLSQCKRMDERSFVLDRISGDRCEAAKKKNVDPICVSKFVEETVDPRASISRFGADPSIHQRVSCKYRKKAREILLPVPFLRTLLENRNSYSMTPSNRIRDYRFEITWWIDYTNCCNNNNDFSCSNSIAEKKTFINAWWWKLMGYGLLFFFHLIQNVIKEEFRLCVYVCLFIMENSKGISLSVINTLNVARSLKILMEFQVESFRFEQ